MFTNFDKRKICEEIRSQQISIGDAAIKYNCAKSTIYSWLQQFFPDDNSDSPSAESLLPSNLTAIKAIVLAAQLEVHGWDSEKAGAECRHAGVKASDLRKFYEAALNEGVTFSREQYDLKRQLRTAKKQIQAAEAEKARFEKALAETAVCLSELKKAQTLFTQVEI